MNTQIIRPPAFQRPSGKLILGSNQVNLVDTIETLVELDTIQAAYLDEIENIVTHRITPGRAGVYSLVGQVRFLNAIADKSYISVIKVTGATVCGNAAHSSLGASVSALCCLPNHYLSETDYVELWATSYAGVDTVDIDATSARTYLALQRVR